MKLHVQALRNIQIFLVENRRDPSLYDIPAAWDSNLSYEANKENIAGQLGIPYERANKQGYAQNTQNQAVSNPKQFRQNMEREECDRLGESCETYCNNAACRTFKKSCQGDITPCPTKERRAELKYRKSSGKSIGDCTVRSYCVAPHTRPPQHNSKTGNPIVVKGYCVTTHPRLCRRKGFEPGEIYGR